MGEVAFTAATLGEVAQRMGFDEGDLEGGTFLYDYANVGHVADRWGMDFWWACPASYVRFNPNPALPVAQAAVDAAQWIRTGAPQWALDGTPPTPRMASLIEVALAYWRIEEAEAKARAYEEARNNVKNQGE